MFEQELAECELGLSNCGAARMAAIVSMPLGVLLATDSVWVSMLVWPALALLFFALLRGWGYSFLALFAALLSVYLMLALDSRPWWILVAGLFVALCMLAYLRVRLRQLRALREESHRMVEGRCVTLWFADDSRGIGG
jgi:hypothetical protein